MARKVPRFLIGVFVIAGLLLTAVVIIWLGATRYFEGGKTYVTFFDESVQGLQRDSTVKYRGVVIGRVESIEVAPDNVLIQVVMRIEFGEDWENKATARLKPAGITGIVFLDLEPIDPGKPDMSPKLSFVPKYPVIRSRPSDIRALISNIEQVVNEMKELNVGKMVSQVEAAAVAGEKLMKRPEIDRVLKNLESLTAHLDSVTARMDRVMGKGDIEVILSDAKDTTRELKGLTAQLRASIEALRLPDTAGKMNRTIDNLDRTTATIAEEITAAGENLQRASENMELLMERLKTNPSALLFSRPPKGRGSGEQ
jgi:phospholipid/cholesterol/gamma-HCH transport system substrate-binding protein